MCETGDAPAKIRLPGSGSRSSAGGKRILLAAGAIAFANASQWFPDALSPNTFAPSNVACAESGRMC
jgi:hypothetical protein